MKPIREPLKLSREELQALLERAKTAPLDEADYQKLKAVVETLGYLTELLEDRKTTIQRLRQMLFGVRTEKTREVLKTDGPPSGSPTTQPTGAENGTPSDGQGSPEKGSPDHPRKGHGRNGAAAYHGATKVTVRHESLQVGDACPECLKGKVYASGTPGFLVRVVGQAPLGAHVYELEKLRCNLCGEMYTAREPEGVGPEKYDETSASMISLLKYGTGTPFYRLEGLQGSLGIPLPASTQWEIVQETAGRIEPAFGELVRQAAQGEVLYNDDTTAQILTLMRERPTGEQPGPESERTGVFTSGIVSTRQGCQMALFFTGHRHAGENLENVLRQRAKELGPPIQMCDALSRNLPKALDSIVANCIAHSRRRFIDVAPNFWEECRYVLETLGEVYKNDALAREQGMTPDARLAFHQAHSGPLMEELEKWLREQIAERKVEPHSGLGKAISYMKDHWKKLSLFLRVPGAPLDNNICERALKKAILHRKNSMFFKTTNGAHVADVFMSLIHTCQLCRANPFDYLTELQRHAGELAKDPQAWMPWNYRETLDRSAPARAAPP